MLLLLIAMSVVLASSAKIMNTNDVMQNRCPPDCVCYKRTVRCMFLRLKQIPESVAGNTEML